MNPPVAADSGFGEGHGDDDIMKGPPKPLGPPSGIGMRRGSTVQDTGPLSRKDYNARIATSNGVQTVAVPGAGSNSPIVGAG